MTRHFKQGPHCKAEMPVSTTLTPKRILIVDDEPAIRRLLCAMLAEEGYLISQAANGADALQHLRMSHCDLVILDLMMPTMTGLEFATACHQLDGCGDLPIILLSALGEAIGTAAWLPSMGVQACLGKPFDLQELLALVKRHV